MIFHDSLILLISACIIYKNLAKAEFIENKRAENWKKSSNRKCKILKINNGTLQTNGWTFDVDHKDFASLVIQTLPRESKLTFSYLKGREAVRSRASTSSQMFNCDQFDRGWIRATDHLFEKFMWNSQNTFVSRLLLPNTSNFLGRGIRCP